MYPKYFSATNRNQNKVKKLPGAVPYTSTATRTFEKDTSEVDLNHTCQETKLDLPPPKHLLHGMTEKLLQASNSIRPHLADMGIEHSGSKNSLRRFVCLLFSNFYLVSWRTRLMVSIYYEKQQSLAKWSKEA